VNAGVGSSNSSGNHTAFFQQLKNNMNNSLGLTLSVPIFDNRQNKTNVEKAKLARQNYELSLQDAEKTLYQQIETYWLNARNAQQQYIYAKANVRSMQESYDLVSEQFNLGLKNIVELTTGKNNLLQAEQQLLQTKYTALLNSAMLRFYAGERLKL
jgi:outer membrane protein